MLRDKHWSISDPTKSSKKRSGLLRLGAVVLVWLICLLLTSFILSVQAATSAAPNSGPVSNVDQTAGSFNTTTNLEVPKFRDLEPNLALVLNSQQGNGLVGVNWGLKGRSSIQRFGPNRGYPGYDAKDTFFLDDKELIPDTSMGGNYSTKYQDYRRIVRDYSNKIWYVQDKNGNAMTYRPTIDPTGSVLRWSVSTVSDTLGNTVNYTYWQDGGNESYLDAITYNGVLVKFYYELRPDPISYANGVGSTLMRYRLKSVDISVNTKRVRAYKLTYTTSASTGRSLLISVQEFGQDASVDTSGTITGATALPPISMGYTVMSNTFSPTGWPIAKFTLNSGVTPDPTRVHVTDMDGNGRADLLMYGTLGGYQVALNNGTGFNVSNWTNNATMGATSDFDPARVRTGDSSGDGKDDVTYFNKDGSLTTALSTGSGLTLSNWPVAKFDITDPRGADPARLFEADFDGNGSQDYLFFGYSGGLQVALSTGNGFVVSKWTGMSFLGSQTAPDPRRIKLGDFTGDGLIDVLYYNEDGHLSAAISTGSSFIISDWTPNYFFGSNANTNPADIFVSDFSGDSKADVLFMASTGSKMIMEVAQSNGTSFVQSDWTPSIDFANYQNFDPSRVRIADTNGDSRSDVLWYGFSGGLQVEQSTGIGFNVTAWYPNQVFGDPNHPQNWFMGSFTGSGRADSLWFSPSDASLSVVASGGGVTNPDLLNNLANGIGGLTKIVYVSDSTWAGRNLPVGYHTDTVQHVTVTDTKSGINGTTAYVYAGATWRYQDRMPQGFKTATAVYDQAGDQIETVFHTVPNSLPGQLHSVTYKNSSGAIYNSQTWTYVESQTAPYTSMLTSTSTSTYNLQTTPRTVRTDYQYDNYGNQTQMQEYGDINLTIQRTTVTGYVYNPSLYIVNRPAYTELRAGLGTSGQLLSRVQFVYDTNTDINAAPLHGLVTQQQTWNNVTNSYIITKSSFDSYGNRTSSTDSAGATTSYQFDPIYHIYPISQTNTLGQTVITDWDTTLGLPIKTTDSNGIVGITIYDALGRTIQTSLDNTWRTKYNYADWGTPDSQRIETKVNDGSSSGLVTKSYFDGLGRTYKTVEPGGYTQTLIYNDATNLPYKKSLWRASSGTSIYEVFSYDGLHRLLTDQHPDGSASKLQYFATYTRATDELGHYTDSYTDAFGNRSKTIEYNGSQTATTSYNYNLLNQAVLVTDAAGHASQTTWDTLGRVISQNLSDLGSTRYTYADGRNLITTSTDAKNQTITFGYDLMGRPTTKTYSDGQKYTWTYDSTAVPNGIGRLASSTYPGGSISITKYDAAGNVLVQSQTVEGLTYKLGFSYDKAFRLNTVTYPDETVTYAYGTDGLLASISGYVNQYTYNPAGQVIAASYANGVSENFNYDANREWLTSDTVANGSKPLYSTSYSYDKVARVTKISGTDPTMNLNYNYDDLNRLIGVSGGQTQTFTYDLLGNITSNSQMGNYTYGNATQPHAVTKAGSNNYGYDADGNIISGAGRTFTWNADNWPVSITQGTNSSFYEYNARGQRTQKIVKSDSTTTTTKYFGPLLENDNGQMVKYIYAGANLVARSVSDTAKTKEWYHVDRLNSVRVITNNAGNVAATYSYSPFGKQFVSSGSSSNSYGFSGQITDAETGLDYMNGRYFDPQLARFISADSKVPSANPQHLNRYSYASNNPTNRIDPSGHDDFFVDNNLWNISNGIDDVPLGGTDWSIGGTGGSAGGLDGGTISTGVNNLPGFGSNNTDWTLGQTGINASIDNGINSFGNTGSPFDTPFTTSIFSTATNFNNTWQLPTSLSSGNDNTASLWSPRSFGVIWSAEAEGGLLVNGNIGLSGGATTISLGVGDFLGDNYNTISSGAFTSDGGFFQSTTLNQIIHNTDAASVIGASFGVGPSLFASNARNVSDLSGAFSTFSLYTPIPFIGTLQFGLGNSAIDNRPIWIFSYGPLPSIGLSYSNYTTSTPWTHTFPN